MPVCRACGDEFSSGGRGRPALYCCVGCRRAVEYRRRRAARKRWHADRWRDMAKVSAGSRRRHQLGWAAELDAEADELEKGLK